MDFEKFDRHMNKPHKFKIDGDEFEICPIPIESIGDFVTSYNAVLKLQSLTDLNDISDTITDDVLAAMSRAIKVSLQRAYPELSEDKLNAFIVRNFFTLLGALFAANPFHADKEATEAALKRLEELRKARANVPPKA